MKRKQIIFETVMSILSENDPFETEGERIRRLGGKAKEDPGYEEREEHWKSKRRDIERTNPTVQSDTGKTTKRERTGIMPDGGEWEAGWRGTRLDAANGTYTDQGEYNRRNFKQIVQQPPE